MNPQQRVVFLDTSRLPEAGETRAGETLNNAGEATLMLRLTRTLLAAGLPAESIGLISPFTSQVILGASTDTPPPPLSFRKCRGSVDLKTLVFDSTDHRLRAWVNCGVLIEIPYFHVSCQLGPHGLG